MFLDISTAVFLSALTLWLLATSILKFRTWSTANVLSLTFSLACLFVCISEASFFLQELGYYSFLQYRSMSLIVLQAITMAAVGLLSIETLNSKKIKTIWRIPLIGILLSYFSLEYHLIIQFIFCSLTVIVFWLNRSSLRILKGKMIFHLLISGSFFLINDYYFWLYNIVLFMFILNLSSLWDMVRIKQMIYVNEKSKGEK